MDDLLWGFRKGQRVRSKSRGWTGVVQGEPSDSGTVWCAFDSIGQAGVPHDDLERYKEKADGRA